MTDFRSLNKAINHVDWPFPSSDSLRESILPHSNVFFALDCLAGYHQIPIREEDRKFLSFMTPYRKFQYNKLPMVYSDSSDQFLIHSDPLVRGIKQVDKSVDDILGQCTSFNHLATCLNEILTCAINSDLPSPLKSLISTIILIGWVQVRCKQKGRGLSRS